MAENRSRRKKSSPVRILRYSLSDDENLSVKTEPDDAENQNKEIGTGLILLNLNIISLPSHCVLEYLMYIIKGETDNG